MPESPHIRRFFDEFAEEYHLLYPDWSATVIEQGRALDAYVRRALGDGPHALLDCACGIGTQAIGLALTGHHVTGTDLSPAAVARAAREAAARGVRMETAAADMRYLPFGDGAFDGVVCADNSLAHLLTPPDLLAALAAMHRVLRPGGALLIGMRDYEEARAVQQRFTPTRLTRTSDGRPVIGLQFWHWHEDREHYDFDLIHLLPDGDTWQVHSRRATSWALTRKQLTPFVTEAGFAEVRWHEPEESGYIQPLLTARRVG
ncbi:class I SAM-dependent methyltransferase [Streptomyces sp. NPDC003077]|uniref:class I SAM-dependent methyltransferase n=1 Tax=Streptomyces sp. NPDC003077 TaxID=3154443 RepID=UPI0033A2DCA5